MVRLARVALVVALSASGLVAQEGSSLSTGSTPSSSRPSTPADAPLPNESEIQKKEQSQRILGVVPLFSMTNRKDAPPLTSKQKFKLFAKSTVDPFNIALVGIQAGISQDDNSFEEYGQGASGYFKRFGAAMADSTSSSLFSGFVYPSLLKTDPRFFRLGEGSFKKRFGYALAQEFVCRTDKGKRTFNFSNVLGAFTAGGLSNLYYPEPDRGVGLTMSRSAIALAYGSLSGLVDEFWPDIDRKFFHKKK